MVKVEFTNREAFKAFYLIRENYRDVKREYGEENAKDYAYYEKLLEASPKLRSLVEAIENCIREQNHPEAFSSIGEELKKWFAEDCNS